MLGVTPYTVRQWARDGKLPDPSPGQVPGGSAQSSIRQWLVDQEETHTPLRRTVRFELENAPRRRSNG